MVHLALALLPFLLLAMAESFDFDDENDNTTGGVQVVCDSAEGRVDCFGSCVFKISIDVHTEQQFITSGCQHWESEENKTGNGFNKCDIRRVGMLGMRNKVARRPYAIEYLVNAEGNQRHVYKLCCWTPFCNQQDSIRVPLSYLKDHIGRNVEVNEQVTMKIVLLVIVVTVLIPIWSIFRSKKDEFYESDVRPRMDQGLLDESVEPKAVKKDITLVSGQLTVHEISLIISEMMQITDTCATPSSNTDLQVMIMPPQTFQASGYGHCLVKALRSRPQHLQSLLFRLIEQGPYAFPFKASELLELFDEAKDVFLNDASLVHISSSVIVIGDLRGAYSDLHRWLDIVGWPPRTRLLFLGNTIDKDEPGSLETIALISALKIAFPTEVTLLRGVSETLPYTPSGRFPAKASAAIGSCLARMFGFLPTSAIIMDKVLAVPSGISPLVKSLSALSDIFRPTSLEDMHPLTRHLIFNQPSTKVRMYRPNPTSRGDIFGVKAVDKMRDTVGVNLIIRGGSPVPNGFLSSWDNTLMSIWSNPWKGTRRGAIVSINSDMEVMPIRMTAQQDQFDALMPESDNGPAINDSMPNIPNPRNTTNM